MISILNRQFGVKFPHLASNFRFKYTLDYSKVPKLIESDLEEQFVKGSGPGGQATNKSSNCVVLKHLPTDFKSPHIFGISNASLLNIRILEKSHFINSMRFKHSIDYSNVPKLLESDLEEKFVRGSGPGGSAVNKNSNCVVLKHLPTGLVIKCHESRSLDDNRKTAREKLITKLDNIQNGPNSIEAQKLRIQTKKSLTNEKKLKKLRLLKEEWKAREKIK